MKFTTKHLQIRPIEKSEYPELLKIYSHALNMKYIQDGKYNWTLDEITQKWIDEHRKGNVFSIVVHKVGQKIIGEANLINTKETASDLEIEIGYLLDESYWGQGLGTELCKGLMAYCFDELKLERVKAGLYTENVRSSRLLKKAGFKLYKSFTTLSHIGVELYEYPPRKIP